MVKQNKSANNYFILKEKCKNKQTIFVLNAKVYTKVLLYNKLHCFL